MVDIPEEIPLAIRSVTPYFSLNVESLLNASAPAVLTVSVTSYFWFISLTFVIAADPNSRALDVSWCSLSVSTIRSTIDTDPLATPRVADPMLSERVDA